MLLGDLPTTRRNEATAWLSAGKGEGLPDLTVQVMLCCSSESCQLGAEVGRWMQCCLCQHVVRLHSIYLGVLLVFNVFACCGCAVYIYRG
jgi:hypothetical protein